MATTPQLLTRDDFRARVFARDGSKCVICKAQAQDAHHIMERRLFPDGGYYLDNGASLCGVHHYAAETTELTVEAVRTACRIKTKILPPEYYPDQPYDKWGNPILPDGRRMRGELFDDESVQRVLSLGGAITMFTHYVKYPRTWHLPWTEGATDSDRMLEDVSCFTGKRVIVTEKMDGENTTMYRAYVHARSLDGRGHPSRDFVKNLQAGIGWQLPDGWRLCGENLHTVHSITYQSLPSYFLVFSMWDESNVCLSWDETLKWCDLLNLQHVPVLYEGLFDEAKIRAIYDSVKDWAKREGYVIRLADPFHYGEFNQSVAKFVRRDHVLTTKHWLHGQPLKVNQLAQ